VICPTCRIGHGSSAASSSSTRCEAEARFHAGLTRSEIAVAEDRCEGEMSDLGGTADVTPLWQQAALARLRPSGRRRRRPLTGPDRASAVRAQPTLLTQRRSWTTSTNRSDFRVAGFIFWPAKSPKPFQSPQVWRPPGCAIRALGRFASQDRRNSKM
jgi:hypothetical protein